MRKTLFIITAIAVLGSAAAAAAIHSPLLTLPRSTVAGQQTIFGRIAYVKHRAHSYELGFDPAWWLTGFTAKRAHLADTGSREVPNDYYIVDETHRVLAYILPRSAHVTVLRGGTNTTTIAPAALARGVKSGTTRGQGFWIKISSKYPSAVLSIDQQYQP